MNKFVTRSLIVGLVAVPLMAGCDAVGEKEIVVEAANDPLNQPRMLLKNYVDGKGLGSETTSYAYIVNEVKKTDEARAKILEDGFKELQSAEPDDVPKIAQEILIKIQPMMKPM